VHATCHRTDAPSLTSSGAGAWVVQTRRVVDARSERCPKSVCISDTRRVETETLTCKPVPLPELRQCGRHAAVTSHLRIPSRTPNRLGFERLLRRPMDEPLRKLSRLVSHPSLSIPVTWVTLLNEGCLPECDGRESDFSPTCSRCRKRPHLRQSPTSQTRRTGGLRMQAHVERERAITFTAPARGRASAAATPHR
jgi:hypothetical protein